MGNVRNPLTGKFHPKYPKSNHRGCKECGDPIPRAFSLYCWRHRKKHERTRSPNGRFPTRTELKPYRDVIEVAMMIGVEQEPDTLKAFDWFHRLIRVTVADRILQAQLNRLLQDGATGREMAIRVMTVIALQTEQFGGRPDLGHGELTPDNLRAAMGNQMLRATAPPRRAKLSGKRSREIPLPGRVMFQLGDFMVDRGAFGMLLRLWKTCQYRYEQARGDHLCKLFREVPGQPDAPRELRPSVAERVATPTPSKRKDSPRNAEGILPPPSVEPYIDRTMPTGHDADGLPTFEET